MAAPTRRRHGHVAGSRHRPVNPTHVDRPIGAIEEPDDDEARVEPAEAALDTEDAVDDVAEDKVAQAEAEGTAEDEPAEDEPAEVEPAGDEPAAEESAAVESAAVESAEPTTQEDTGEEDTSEGEAVEDAADGDELTPDGHSGLFAWLAGDGESLADLLGPEKRTQTYIAAGPPAVGPSPRPLARPPRLDRQSFRRATDAPRVAPPSPPAPPVTVRPPPRPGRRRRTVVLVTVVAVAVALVAGVVALVVPRSGSGNKASATTSQATTTAPIAPPIRTSPETVVSWVKENLPSTAAMIAPAALVPPLQRAGFTAVFADDALAGLTLADVFYLVGEPTAATPTGQLKTFIDATAPLGYFGTGAKQTMVGQVFRGGTIAMAQAMMDDTTLRAEEGSGLLRNPNVRSDAAMREVLANGLLDARAGALIGVLAGVGQVTVTDPARSAPEAAAGLPFRIVTISVSNPVLLDNSVRRADPKYKPVSAVPVGATQRRLTWTPAVAPDKPFR